MNPADLFAQDADRISLSPGAALFHVGDVGNEMFVVLEGLLDIKVGESVVETAMRGALIGEMALIEASPRTATVVAKTACRLARINERRFHQLLQQNPEFGSHVMKVLVDRLREMNRRLTAS
jgi:CRP/FNR family transcriptional regulator, cyclic AMP receptor protein